jgi:hypothetical protein
VGFSLFAPFPLLCLNVSSISSHSLLVFHLFSFAPNLPSPFTCAWSFQSSYYLVLSILSMHFLCTLGALDPCCAHFTHTKYYQSLLCTLYVRLMFSILFMHFPCAPSAFNPFYVCLVLLILFACFLPTHGAFDLLYTCLVLYLLSFNTDSFDPLCVHLVLCFISQQLILSLISTHLVMTFSL